MNFPQAVQTCLKKYVDFSGRASRSEYWWFALAYVIVMVITGAISETLSSLLALGALLPSLAVATRRLHDIGKSGWWQLLVLTGIGFLLLLYWYVQPSSPESNEYGAAAAGAPDAPALPPGAV
jgi:uncharacterized membrane protein YhaH (DUF805 family)